MFACVYSMFTYLVCNKEYFPLCGINKVFFSSYTLSNTGSELDKKHWGGGKAEGGLSGL